MIPSKKVKLQTIQIDDNKLSIYCINGNPSQKCCINKQCKQYAFTCNNKNCQCQKQHTNQNRKCLPTQTQYIYENLLSKNKEIHKLKDNIQQAIQRTINNLLSKKVILCEIVEQKFKDILLSMDEKLFLKGLEQGYVSWITGEVIGGFAQQSSMIRQAKEVKMLQKFIQKADSLWRTMNQAIQNVMKKMTNLLSDFYYQITTQNMNFPLLINLNPQQQLSSKPVIFSQNKFQLMALALKDQSNHMKIKQLINQMYKSMPQVTVSMYVLNKQLHKNRWQSIESIKKIYDVKLTEQAYSLCTILLKQGFWYKKLDIKRLFVADIKYDHIQQIECGHQDCMIDDKGWRVLVENAQKFTNLKMLWLRFNKIKQISQFDLEQFISLEFLNLQQNPLSYSSIQNIKNFKSKNKNVKIYLTTRQKTK